MAAAKALLEQHPDTSGAAGERVLVVFRGREGKGQQLASDIEPEVLAAAIEQVQRQRAEAEERELAAFADESVLDREDMELAWQLYADPDARAAALRVYLMKQQPQQSDEPG